MGSMGSGVAETTVMVAQEGCFGKVPTRIIPPGGLAMPST